MKLIPTKKNRQKLENKEYKKSEKDKDQIEPANFQCSNVPIVVEMWMQMSRNGEITWIVRQLRRRQMLKTIRSHVRGRNFKKHSRTNFLIVRI